MAIALRSDESIRAGLATAARARHKASRTSGAWWALLPAVAALTIGYIGAGQRQMWEDEYATYHAVTISWPALGQLLRHIDLVHALYYLFMRAWMAICGDSLLALRTPSLLAIAASAACVAILGRRLVDTPTGVLAGLAFASLPAASRYAQEVRSYALVTFGATLGTVLLFRAMDRPNGRRWSGYAACMALVGLGHFVALTIIGAHSLWILLSTTREDPRRYRFAGAVGGALVVVVPLIGLATKQSGQISWVTATLTDVEGFPGKMLLSRHAALLVYPLALFGGVALWRTRRAAGALLLAWAVPPPIFVYVTYPWLHLFVARYILFTLPAWALLATAGAILLGRLVFRVSLRPAWVATGVVAVAAIGYLGYHDQVVLRHSPVAGQPAYRPALLYVTDHAQAGDGIAYNDHFGGRDVVRAAAEYELRNRPAPRDVFLYRPASGLGTYGATECPNPAACLGDTRRLWVVTTTTSTDPLVGMPSSKKALLGKNFSVSGKAERFPGVRVVLLVRKSP